MCGTVFECFLKLLKKMLHGASLLSCAVPYFLDFTRTFLDAIKHTIYFHCFIFQISNLEKLLEVQNAKFNAAIDELTTKLALETEKRQALQMEVEKLAHCVTQV